MQLTLSMLRFTHIVSGSILYDGIDITKIPRRRLREALTIIPQEAVLFSGTVESNLDPAGAVPREMLQKALDSCKAIASFQYHSNTSQDGTNGHAATNGHYSNGLTFNGNYIPSSGNGPETNGYDTEVEGISLSAAVTSKGENFSHGQRQVLSLCRALVRKSRLMLLDEATASMDYETDREIQDVLRKELNAVGRDRTLLTIAHRLRTIIDYDTIVVMGGGKVLE